MLIVGPVCTNPARVAIPPGAVIRTFGEDTLPTIAMMVSEDTTLNELALLPPKPTAVVPVKLAPVIVTEVPVPAFVGVNKLITGFGIKTNPGRNAESIAVVTLILPLAPESTMA